MRKIKFRAWDKANFEMFQVGFLEFIQSTGDLILPAHCSDTIMQYIGLKDKNDVEIYEGDIMKVNNYDNQIQIAEIYGVVIFSYGSFGIKVKHVAKWVGYNKEVKPSEILWFLNIVNSKPYEVIGNIYENLELLKS